MNEWNGTSQSLPNEREYVQFIVAGHRQLFYGVYSEHYFRSRWAAYLPREIGVWRKLGGAPRAPLPPRTRPERRYWSDRPMRDSNDSASLRRAGQSLGVDNGT